MGLQRILESKNFVVNRNLITFLEVSVSMTQVGCSKLLSSGDKEKIPCGRYLLTLNCDFLIIKES